MKAWIQTTPDFDYEVVDVFLFIDIDGAIINTWIKGFDDDEWEEAERFAKDLAKLLHCEYVGEVA